MKVSNNNLSKGFILAGIMNISGVLISSRLFTNTTLAEFDPIVMSNFGLLMIMIWGLAYISVAYDFEKVKWLLLVFAIEKFIYGFVWIKWILNNNLSDVFAQDQQAGLFFSVYGINDWLFFIFFTFVFIKVLRSSKS